ncbi:MAG: hypothetical protein IJ529_01620 [Alphaproteobacteria bacterium]|nr:hypothetical protein [Alphaproteobacteria bacterium]
MKKSALALTAAFLASFEAAAAEDVVKVSGSACEIFNANQPKSSVRVRVTDKASYNAVAQIPSLAELKSQMLELDYNVIIYNLVDNYVQNMSVKTTSQDENELCVEVTGAIPAVDIVNVIANYSPANPAPDYDFKKENGIIVEKAEPYKENLPSTADIMYNGKEEFNKIAEPSSAPIAYQPEENTESAKVEPQNIIATNQPIYQPEGETKKAENTYIVPDLSDVMVDDNYNYTPEEEQKNLNALVYVAPVEFSNNTHSSKPIGVVKDLFSNEDVYTLLDNPDGADYVITSKVLKAKIDPINSQTKRMQMVVSIELKINGADGSISDHQNRFVLFENGENEQEVAMNLLKKLLRKAAENIFPRIEQNESKRDKRPFLTPAKSSAGL